MDTTYLKHLTEIGIALSAEKNIHKILELIVEEARRLSTADGGTLYIVDPEYKHLKFEIVQNESLNIRMGGTSDIETPFPPVPFEIDGQPNNANVSSYVALTDETVNIPDLYEAEGFDFSGARKYDEASGYRSKSILVIPMKNHEETIIGVLQPVNATDPETQQVVPFSPQIVDLIASLASQAAVALTNRKLIEDLASLFDSFIQTIASAIDEKSPYTGGHIRRVTTLTMMIARKINATQEGRFANVHFNEDELEELRMAAWMHDIGKIVLPEHVVSKRTKLECVFDRIHLIETRLELIRQLKKNECWSRKFKLLDAGQLDRAGVEELERELERDIGNLRQYEECVIRCNRSGKPLDDEDVARLREISQHTYRLDGEEYPYLTEDELKHLLVRRGNLTPAERKIIESHALMSIRMLNGLPFPKKLERVPEYAGGHHEKLDGTGYPLGLRADQLSLQTRIIAIADIFEALTARDRPYKSAMTPEKAIQILEGMKDNHIDSDLYDLLIHTGLFKEYVKHELD